MTEIKPVRFVKTSLGVVYLRKEDVVDFLRDFAATEETDVRNRLNEAASNISEVGTGEVGCREN